MKQTIKDLNLTNKRVILRVDFNVPIINGEVGDVKRIEAALPTIKYILDQGASLIILSHLGRIKSNEDKLTKTLAPVAKKFEELLQKKVIFIPETRSELVTSKAQALKPGEILFLENTRFEDLNDKAESKNNETLAKYWASLGDVFINDAFATAHRAHASNAGIAVNIKESALGFLIQEEIEHLDKLMNAPKRPYLAIIGGAKVSDKIKVLEKLFETADKVLIGGGMAYTFRVALGKKVGQSLFEPEYVDMAKKYLELYKDKIVLPVDNGISKTFSNETAVYTTVDNSDISDDYMGMDIGPETVKLFEKEIAKAKTIFWNGPLGVTEFSNFEIGTKKIAMAIANNNDCYSVVGGGDSVSAINKLGYQSKFSFISTGGGASIEFVQGNVLPGIDTIQNK
ncbi:Phosphoglycerate kinase [Metamycoplasma cloacale]|uniref:Phosphoglycerate kinase n=1 Tax=Metamycoplasma cloacale TaxID=92401 RepID=A0A2Z4LMF1_9BACT|nr:phosphoglycerate kinase [Metamycoplasma cloacale]AWX42939.1 phosphoglycerate kinase [Metamycoplasma cloacale]VEU79237.1 Phosphoglycerate kinase [Metamycoplasma cloacale]